MGTRFITRVDTRVWTVHAALPRKLLAWPNLPERGEQGEGCLRGGDERVTGSEATASNARLDGAGVAAAAPVAVDRVPLRGAGLPPGFSLPARRQTQERGGAAGLVSGAKCEPTQSIPAGADSSWTEKRPSYCPGLAPKAGRAAAQRLTETVLPAQFHPLL